MMVAWRQLWSSSHQGLKRHKRINGGHTANAIEQLEIRVLPTAIPLGDVFSVPSRTLNNQNYDAIATDGNGNFTVVFADEGLDSSGWGVYARRFAADGTPQGNQFRINSTIADDQHYPSIATNDSGVSLIVWENYRSTGAYSFETRLDLQFLDVNGDKLGGNVNLIPEDYETIDPGTYLSWSNTPKPLVFSDSAGEFWVAVPVTHSDGVFYGKGFQFWKVGTDGIWTNAFETRLANEHSGAAVVQYPSDVQLGPDGTFYVTYDVEHNEAIPDVGQQYTSQLIVRRFSSSGGQQIGSDILVDSAVYYDDVGRVEHRQPTLIPGDSGQFSVLFYSHLGDLVVQHFDADGVKQGLKVKFIDRADLNPSYGVGEVSGGTLSNGNWLLAWNVPVAFDDDTYYAREFQQNGTPVGPAIPLGTAYYTGPIHLARQSNDQFVASWGGGTIGYGDIFARRLAANIASTSPTDIALSSTSIPEHNLGYDTVGLLTATDPDVGETFTFGLVDGPGSTDNSSFFIVGNSLQIIPSTDYASQSSYSIRVEVADRAGLTFQKQFTIQVIKANLAPTGISLSSTSIDEHNASYATVGLLGATDPDIGDTFTFSLVGGAGSTDNGSFVVNGNALQIIPSTNFSTQSSYSVRIQVADQGGMTYTKQFTINVTDLNDAPTSVTLSATSLVENNVPNATVGILSASDPDTGNTFTFSLVTGAGSTDNPSFTITGNTLKIIPVTNYALKNSYTLRVRVTDQGGLTFEKPFTITITDANAAPTNLTLSSTSLMENHSPYATVGTMSTTDPDVGDTFTYSLVAGTGSADNGNFTISGSTLQIITTSDAEMKSSYSIRIRTTDQGGMTFEKPFTITVTDVDEFPTIITLNSEPLSYQIRSRNVVPIDGTATISDDDASVLNFAGSILQVSGQAKKDSLSILKQDGISRKGKNLLFGNVVIATVAGGKKGEALTIRMNSAATQTSVQTLLRSIAFKSTDKIAGARTIQMQITNIGGANTNQAIKQIHVG